jgi:DNA-binding GntR family transcriptional regulator
MAELKRVPSAKVLDATGASGATVAVQLAQDIARRIIAGVYAPGSSLREIPLAEAYGVSRTSIREAFRILERDGVVTIEPRHGASVTRLNTDELVEVYQVRSVLLGLAMAMFCSQCSEDQVHWLETRYVQMKALPGGEQKQAAARHAEISAGMARYIFEGSGNQLLTQLLSRMSLQIARYTLVGLSAPKRRAQSIATWGQVMMAIRSRDAKAAERYGRKLVKDNLRFALSQISGS